MKSFLLRVLLFLSILSTSAFAMRFTNSGEIEGEYDSINLTVRVDEVDVTFFQGDPQGKDLFAYLEVYLPASDKDLALLKAPGAKDSKRNSKFYWEGIDAVKEATSLTTEVAVTFRLKVYSNSGTEGAKTLFDIRNQGTATETITLQVELLKKIGADYRSASKSSEFQVEQLFSKPAEAPEDFDVAPAHKGIDLTWTAVDKVQYTKESVSRKPSSMLVMVFNEGGGDIALKAKLVDSEKGKHEDRECTYTPSEDGDCIRCAENEDIFITSDQEANEGIHKFVIASNNGAYTVNNLDPAKNYIVAIQYLDGTKRSLCKTIQPTENSTLTELNGAADGVAGDPRCFVVSAAFDSAFASHVDIFRWARDRFLLTFDLGQKFMLFYYQNAVPLADTIQGSVLARSVMKAVLYPMAFGLYGVRFAAEYPLLVLISALLLIYAIKWLRLRRSLT